MSKKKMQNAVTEQPEAKVEWKMPGLFKGADADLCYKEMQTLGDNVAPADLLALARDEKTELHKCFDWDDSSAAEKYRLFQARLVMTQMVVPVREEEARPGGVIHCRVMQRGSESYHPLRVFIQQPDEYDALLKRAKGELRSFENRYNTIEEFDELFVIIDKLLS